MWIDRVRTLSSLTMIDEYASRLLQGDLAQIKWRESKSLEGEKKLLHPDHMWYVSLASYLVFVIKRVTVSYFLME